MQKETMIVVAIGLFVVAALLTLGIVAFFLWTGGPQTYSVPVANRDLPVNHRITQQDLRMQEQKQEPPEAVLTDSGKIIGKITAREIQGGRPFQSDLLRDTFRVVHATRSISAGTRIERNMLTVKNLEEDVPEAIADPEAIVGKMVRNGISPESPVTRSQVHFEVKDYVVAAESIPANSLVREQQLTTKTLPARYPHGITDVGKVVDRAVRREVAKGQLIRQGDLYEGEPQLSYFIPLYKRAVTIPVANYNNVSYMLRPGDRVDVYAYLPAGMRKGQKGIPGVQQRSDDPLSTNVLQKLADNAEILSLDGVYQKEQIKQIKQRKKGNNQESGQFTYNNMTLGISLTEAEKLNLIRGIQISETSQSESVRFFVILRPRILQSRYGNRRLNTYDIFNRQVGDKVDQEIDARSIEVIQGRSSQVYEVPEKQ